MWCSHTVPLVRLGARIAGPLLVHGGSDHPQARPGGGTQQRRRQLKGHPQSAPATGWAPQQAARARLEPSPCAPAAEVLTIAGSGIGLDGDFLPKGNAGGLPKWERADGAALYAIGSVWGATDAARRTVLARSEPHERRGPAEMGAWKVRCADGSFALRPAMRVRRSQPLPQPPSPAAIPAAAAGPSAHPATVLLVPVPPAASSRHPQPAVHLSPPLAPTPARWTAPPEWARTPATAALSAPAELDGVDLSDILSLDCDADDETPPPLIDPGACSEPGTPRGSSPNWHAVAGAESEWEGQLGDFLTALKAAGTDVPLNSPAELTA